MKSIDNLHASLISVSIVIVVNVRHGQGHHFILFILSDRCADMTGSINFCFRHDASLFLDHSMQTLFKRS
jgi:hypothetical protein